MQTEILIYAGSLASVSAALSLKAHGKDVLLVTHRNYLGEDICDSLRLTLPADLDLQDPLAKRLFGEADATGQPLRPMHLKHSLDQIVAEADIPVMLGAAPAEFLRDHQQNITGLRVHNRSGDFEITCDQIIDGSLQGDLLRLAGIPLSNPWPEFEVVRRVIGGVAKNENGWIVEAEMELTHGTSRVKTPLWTHHSHQSLKDVHWGGWMQLEQQTRMQAYRFGQELSADGIFAITGEHIHPDKSPCIAHGDLSKIAAEACKAPCGNLWVAGPLAHVDQTAREQLLRHDHAITFGQHLASLLLTSPPQAWPELQPQASGLPTLEVDVLVIGGGTGGAPAAIAAARAGKKTLVAEYLSGLGGVGTLGLIGKYWFGNRVGFTAELDQGARSLTTKEFEEGIWDVEAKMQWYHEEITKAGGSIWYKTMLSRALTDGNRVLGAVLCTPYGEIEVRAKCVVDASGAAAVAFSAGAETVAIGDGHLAVQGTGLPGRNPGANYTNTDYDFIDESNAEDSGSAHITARQKFKNAFDAGQLIDSRERRRVVGDYEITPMDIRLTRVFPDSVVKAKSNFDTHGFTIHPLFMIVPPDHDAQEAFIPLRALLPKGLESILVTGLGISAHRDAMPVIRMQADVQNQGYAAGVIAAMAGENNIRDLDILEIQEHLVQKGILDPEIKGADDSFPLSDEEIDAALWKSIEDPNYIDRVFTLPPPQRLSKLVAAYEQAENERAQQHFAFVLGILGERHGFDHLLQAVSQRDWDQGWNYTGMGQFGESMSALDARIIALGRCKKSEALPVLQQKAESLQADAAFSHFRVLAEAFETIGDPSAAPILTNLLNLPGLTGHYISNRAARLATATGNSEETAFRNRALIELHLASALYRLDPKQAIATEILTAYCHDLRGLFAAHAKRLLKQRL
jgi:hypothetical protein